MNLPYLNVKEFIWKMFYSKWRFNPAKRIPGYTILLPTPADLPIFLKIAMEICLSQNHDGLKEVLVIPDKLSQGFIDYFNTLKQNWHICPIRIIKFLPQDKLIVKLLNSPFHNHWLQLIRGTEATQTTHAVVHDADLFITIKDFFKRHYETSVEHKLACLGVSEVWDKRLKRSGFNHVVATWEMMFDCEWFRSFKPWQHRCQKGFLAKKLLEFDTALLPQCLTPPYRISRDEREYGFIHFNYLICVYRKYQNCKGRYEDNSFRILLLRLLIDIYGEPSQNYEIPQISILEKGLKDANQQITYLGEATRKGYPEFRDKLQKLMDGGILAETKKMVLQQEIRPFDQAFNWVNPK